MADNGITELSPEVGKLSSLTNLFVQGNAITELPATLKDLAAIKRVTLTGNPIPTDTDGYKVLAAELTAVCEKNQGKFMGPEKPAAGANKFGGLRKKLSTAVQ